MDTLTQHFSGAGQPKAAIGRGRAPRRPAKPSSDIHSETEAGYMMFLQAAKNIDEFRIRIAAILQRFDITYFSHQILTSPEAALDIFGNFPIDYVKDYWKNSYFLSDFQLHRCNNSTPESPLFQSDITESLRQVPYLSEEMLTNLDIWQSMHKHGIEDSCGFFFMSNRKPYLMQLAVSRSQEHPNFKEVIHDNRNKLLVIGRCITEIGTYKFKKKFHNLASMSGGPLLLSPRPIALLQALASDFTLNEAALRLNVSISTANQHIAAAKKALKTTTTHGTLIAASKAGLIRY